MKKILKILKGIITVFLIVALIMVIFQKATKNRIAIGHFYIFQVVSESMMPNYKVGDVIVVKNFPPRDLKVGDDITYQGREGDLNGLIITHKITSKREDNGVCYFITKGISNNIEDPEINEKDIYGKVIYHTFLFSLVGRIMTNVVCYYLIFVAVGVSFAYEVITGFIIKDKDDCEEEEGERQDEKE